MEIERTEKENRFIGMTIFTGASLVIAFALLGIATAKEAGAEIEKVWVE